MYPEAVAGISNQRALRPRLSPVQNLRGGLVCLLAPSDPRSRGKSLEPLKTGHLESFYERALHSTSEVTWGQRQHAEHVQSRPELLEIVTWGQKAIETPLRFCAGDGLGRRALS